MELIFNYSTLGEENKVLKGPEKDIIDKKFITVQQLSEEASGTKKKYSRIGPRVFVPYNFDTINLENIRTACHPHIDHDEGMFCNILASEQGPSCTTITQLPKLNLIHCRFIPDNPPEVYLLIMPKEIVSKINLSKRGFHSQHFLHHHLL